MVLLRGFPFFTAVLLLGVVCEPSQLRRHAVPVIYVTGTHYDVGFDTGRTFSGIIRSYIASYERLRQFEKEYKTDAGRDAYDLTLANMRQRYPQYVKELQGVADGAGVPFYQLFLLQMDDLIETINENRVRRDTGGCTSIGINYGDKTVLGHTEDAFGATVNHFYIVSAHIIPSEEDRQKGAVEERYASLSYAGQLPGYTSGFNEHGLVFSINTLSPAHLKPGNTPRTFITRALLASHNFTEAEKTLVDLGLGTANGFSVNMLWSDASGSRRMYNAEVAPDFAANHSIVNIRQYDNEPLYHCNIYHRIEVPEVMGPIIDSSEARLKSIRQHPAPRTRHHVEGIISDNNGTEFPIFQARPDAEIQTICAGIFDLKQGTWSIYIDRPIASEPVAVLPIRFTALHLDDK